MKYPLLSALFHPLFQRFADRPVVEIREYEIVFLTGSVTLDNLQRSIQQFHLERHFCLVPFGQYPLLTIHVYDVAIGYFLDVHEREGSEAGENKNVTNIEQLDIPNSCVINVFSSSSVRNSRSVTLGLMWNWANVFFGISPLKCTHMTTPFSHMHFSHIVPL